MIHGVSPGSRLLHKRAPAISGGAIARFAIVLGCLAVAVLAIALSERLAGGAANPVLQAVRAQK
jgi:hypothetical protein